MIGKTPELSESYSEKPTRELELEADAWQRFERAVEVVAKSPPQPKKAKTKSELLERKNQIDDAVICF